MEIAVDIGGTFTDLVAFNSATGKVTQSKQLTTPAEFSQGVWDCLAKAELKPEDAETLVHGSTVAINIAIEQTGAETALIVSKGTRDVYKIGRQNRPEAYNFLFHRPDPLVPRSRTFEAEERMLANGDVHIALTDAEIDRIVDAVRESGAKAVAICFLHSYAVPAHENKAAGRLRAALGPDIYVTASNEIVREYREYERISTTVMNAYIGPKTSAYVGRMEERLQREGFGGRFLIMQSNGGVMSPKTAKALPVAMMESGPVGGVIAAAEIGKRLGFDDVISFDMGGTTAKTSLIKAGEVSIAQGYYVGGYASGHPVTFPVVDIIEVGAGGGSIAWIDQIGALKLGPQSASSVPGPICYSRGGTEPTVTDANVVLGRIGAKSFLGGEMPLDAEGATAGMSSRLGDRLDMTATQVAHGILQIAVAKMSLAVRGISVERGYDPRDFAMLATGGAGPPHALAIARDLHIPTVIIPNLPAHFSALGMLMTDVRHDYVRTVYQPLLDADFQALLSIYAELGVSGLHALDEAGVDEAARSEIWWMDLRYMGQEFWLQIPIERAEIESGNVAAVLARFNEVHDRRFGHAAANEPLELVNVRLTAVGTRPKIEFPHVGGDGADAQIGTREVYLDDPDTPVACAVYSRERLAPGIRIDGPCVIEEYASTTLLFEGDSLVPAETGELIITVAAR
ncbi:hydantoinase/oxoprolinase family protein [Sphingomonas sp. MMS24-J13]|uniref:hydantoinase/oxoprolinase family protein n=1 Tax=Sphingomonas sp. MMS24-J13 TaxID=3238686 RepID=UPI0038516891